MSRHAKKVHVDFFLIYGLSICLIIILSIINLSSVQHFLQTVTKPDVVEEKKAAPLFDQEAFRDVHITGKAYIVYDLVDQKIIAAKNETTPLPLASITKVMMALSSILHKSKNEKVIILPKSIEDGYDLGLKDHQVWKLSELLKYTLIFSSNDGAETIADNFGGKEFFVKQMNDDAEFLSLNLQFTDPAGRDLHGEIGGKGSALEVAKLFFFARKYMPEILDATTKKRGTVLSSSGKVVGIPNTNQEIQTLPGAEASKTGFTDMAGGNLAVIVDISVGHPVVIVVLGSTVEGRFRDVALLYEALRKSILTTTSSR
jgi:D-alanyl-D-alanine carboxypeptidase